MDTEATEQLVTMFLDAHRTDGWFRKLHEQKGMENAAMKSLWYKYIASQKLVKKRHSFEDYSSEMKAEKLDGQ